MSRSVRDVLRPSVARVRSWTRPRARGKRSSFGLPRTPPALAARYSSDSSCARVGSVGGKRIPSGVCPFNQVATSTSGSPARLTMCAMRSHRQPVGPSLAAASLLPQVAAASAAAASPPAWLSRRAPSRACSGVVSVPRPSTSAVTAGCRSRTSSSGAGLRPPGLPTGHGGDGPLRVPHAPYALIILSFAFLFQSNRSVSLCRTLGELLTNDHILIPPALDIHGRCRGRCRPPLLGDPCCPCRGPGLAGRATCAGRCLSAPEGSTRPQDPSRVCQDPSWVVPPSPGTQVDRHLAHLLPLLQPLEGLEPPDEGARRALQAEVAGPLQRGGCPP